MNLLEFLKHLKSYHEEVAYPHLEQINKWIEELEAKAAQTRYNPGWWPSVADAIDHAYKKMGISRIDGSIPVHDWNLGAHVHEFARNTETKCAHCSRPYQWSQVFRCFDCKASLCEFCAPAHFGPKHQQRADAAHPKT